MLSHIFLSVGLSVCRDLRFRHIIFPLQRIGFKYLNLVYNHNNSITVCFLRVSNSHILYIYY